MMDLIKFRTHHKNLLIGDKHCLVRILTLGYWKDANLDGL